MEQVTRRCERQLPTPREAPRAPEHFTGRAEFLRELTNAILKGARAIALCGMGGIGKTTLAGIVACDSRVEESFSDGTFWIDLQTTDAMSALDRIACTFGHDVSAQMTLPSRTATVRSIVREKKFLVVLDNAWESAEVEPLLPNTATGSCLITTRNLDLANEIASEVISVTTLTEDEGVEFLRKLVRDGDRSICLEITRLLGNLPLALELTGKRARKEARNAWFSWTNILQSLREEKGRLDTVRVTFNLTYERALDDETRALFDRLGLLAPSDLHLDVIACVADTDRLGELADLSLIQQIGAREYRLHPLLHDFAREKAANLDDSDRRSALERACDYFYERAQHLKKPNDIEDIQPILRSHHYAIEARDKERARRVYPWFGDIPIPGFLTQHGYPYTLLDLEKAELSIAKSDGELAYAEHNLGTNLGRLQMYAEAIDHLSKALALYQKEEFDLMIAKVGFDLAQTYHSAGDPRRAIQHFHSVLEIDRKLKAGASLTLSQIGDCYRDLDESDPAIEYYEHALAASEASGDARDQVISLIRLGEMCLQSNPERSSGYLDRAASLESTTLSGWDGARLLTQIGHLYEQLAFNDAPTALRDAVDCYWRAIARARDADSPMHESIAFYRLGSLFEHLFLFPGKQPEHAAALACYERAERMAKGMEMPPGINPRERIETRIRPRLEPEEFAAISNIARNRGDDVISASVQNILQ